MAEQQTLPSEAAQTVPDSVGDSSAAETPSSLLDTVTSEVDESQPDGEHTEQAPAQQKAETPDAKAEESSEAKPEEPEGAPETYEWTSPEGSNIEVDSAPVSALGDAARELNLTNDQAQSILNKVGPALHKHYAEQHQAMIDGWRTALQSDPEVGGTKLHESMVAAKSFFAQFDPTGEALAELDRFGLSVMPAIVRFAVRGRAAISEGRVLADGSGDGQAKHSAKAHFPGSDLND